MSEKLNLTLKVWRQEDNNQTGDFVTYPVTDVNPHMSFLELLDVLNEKLICEGGDPIAFEHDCREGICGSCAMTSMVKLMAPLSQQQHANYTCLISKMGIQ